MLYRIRIGYADEPGIEKINPQSSVVFIMNHRSNIDYILLGYLTLRRVALSFAVGEWAKEQFLELVKKGLTRPEDRALFDLAPLPGQDTPPKPEKKA